MKTPPTMSGRAGETEKQRDSEIANDVVELPTELCAGCPFSRTQRSDHQQGHDGHAANFCAGSEKLYIGDH